MSLSLEEEKAKTAEKIREELQRAIQRDEEEYYERKKKHPNRRVHRSHKNFNRLGRVKWVRLEEAQRKIRDLEDAFVKVSRASVKLNRENVRLRGRLEKLQEILEEFSRQLTRKIKAGPPSDYTDLLIMCKKYVNELRRILNELETSRTV